MRFPACFFCVATACCAFVGCSISDTPKSVAKKYYEAVSIKGDIDGVMQLVESPDDIMKRMWFSDKSDRTKANLTYTIQRKINAEIEQHKVWSKENGGIDSIKIDEVKKGKIDDNDAAIVVVTIRYKNGSKNRDSVDVVKTDKVWKVTL